MSDDFRITFFFGPDYFPERPDTLSCVFNVKKRSWKGGVQVSVELTEEQLVRLREMGQLDELIEMIRAKADPEEFSEYERRTHDLFVQNVCWTKLDLAIAAGITQENQTIAARALTDELELQVKAERGRIHDSILSELDL
jgi:hypothetical protein